MTAGIRNLVCWMIALPASAGLLGAQAQGSVSVSAYVLPSSQMVEERGPSVETAFSVLASASIDVAGLAQPSGSGASVVAHTPPASVTPSRTTDGIGYVEFATAVVMSANVASDVVVQSLSGDAAAPDAILVQDVSGTWRRLGPGSPVPVATGGAEPSRRRIEVRYRVRSDRTSDVMELPLRIVLQASSVL